MRVKVTALLQEEVGVAEIVAEREGGLHVLWGLIPMFSVGGEEEQSGTEKELQISQSLQRKLL